MMIEYKNNKYEVIDKIPKDYFVWNIGEDNAPSGYLPLCQKLTQNKDDYRINPGTLRAIEVNPLVRRTLLNAAGYGINSKQSAEKELQRKREPKTYIAKMKRRYAETCLSIFETISK